MKNTCPSAAAGAFHFRNLPLLVDNIKINSRVSDCVCKYISLSSSTSSSFCIIISIRISFRSCQALLTLPFSFFFFLSIFERNVPSSLFALNTW